MENVDPSKLYKNITVCYTGYVMIKGLSNVKLNSVNPLQLIIDKINVYIEHRNENRCLTQVSTDESKDTLG